MNNCTFIGKISEHPEIKIDDNNGANYCILEVMVEEVKRSKGVKKKMYNRLFFEVWDSAADTICSTCTKGTLIAIEASARCDEETEEIYFRINNFKVLS